MTDRMLCIHGHFYQPPREDPWLGAVLPEGSAAPGRDWNARITRESYAPLARARVLDGEGRIREIMNTYEYVSFNFGPTLLSWMQVAAPQTYELVLEADRASRARLGFGNAMAQIRHHSIMPLATADEKRIETAWAVQDFEARYGRLPEGLWLPEAAADTPTLEALAEAGIAYTVLAPRQAAAVSDPGGQWKDVDEGSLDITAPYRVELPSGRSVAVFFYHGGLSQAVAFERLLADGGSFWNRVRAATGPGLTSLATDGETYGHHFKFGEMALAFLIDRARDDEEVELTNFAAYLAANPPARLVRLHEPSSWSCVHGVGRWQEDCGCHTGDRPGWNQRWRGPLRQALRGLKTSLDAHYAEAGAKVFQVPGRALEEYGRVLAGSRTREDFAAGQFAPGLDEAGIRAAWGLLAMQRQAHASFASCAWFFDDLDRIEPLNAMACALRAVELAAQTGAPGGAEALEGALAKELAQARSNATQRHPQGRAGDALLREEAVPRRGTPASLVLHALLLAWADGRRFASGGEVHRVWPGVAVTVHFDGPAQNERLTGEARVVYGTGEGQTSHPFAWDPPAPDAPWASRLRLDGGDWLAASDLAWNKRQDVVLAWDRARAREAWEALREQARVAHALTLPLSESQAGQNEAEHWERLLPALAIEWLLSGGTGEADQALETMLRTANWCDAAKEILSGALAEHAAGLLAGDAPDWAGLDLLAARAEAIAAPVGWWETQNLVWSLGAGGPEVRAAARRIGLAGPFAAP